MKKYIITADDFGAEHFIDDAIYAAIEKGTVSCVSAFVTFQSRPGSQDENSYIGSIKAIKALHSKHPSIGIGLHLNFTTGFPIGDMYQTLADERGRFHRMEDFDFQNTKVHEVVVEIEHQISVFKQLNIPIDHITCHHGLLNLWKPYWNELIKILKRESIPVRNPVLISDSKWFKKKEGFRKSLMKKRGLRIGIRLIKDNGIIDLIKALASKTGFSKAIRKKKLKTTDYFIDTFYGCPSITQVKNIIKNGPQRNNVFSEFLVHLGKDTETSKAGKAVYGMDRVYAKQMRPKETEVMLSDEVSELFQANLKLYSYSDL